MINLTGVDKDIFSYLQPSKLRSFFLFAGAGSGKTRTLINVLDCFRHTHLMEFVVCGKKIAVITYTNAACDEIKERLNNDESFEVSTIHSFAWGLIKPYTSDIKAWIVSALIQELSEVQEAQRKGRSGSKSAAERALKIVSIQRRLENLKSVSAFRYNPNGISSGKDSLNHSEVLKIASSLIVDKPLLQKILIESFPILLIDESQDTQRDLIEAFLDVQSRHAGSFCLGLLGDVMQRIYPDGKKDLGKDVPEDWAVPEKKINYRCPPRIVELINNIRSVFDGHRQIPEKKKPGYAHLFVVDSNGPVDRLTMELKISDMMSQITQDKLWNNLRVDVKTLTLEHHMAATRGGFADFFKPLYELSNRTDLVNGRLTGIPFLINVFIPFVQSVRAANKFRVMQILKEFSPLVTSENLKSSAESVLKEAKDSVEALARLLAEKTDPTIHELLSVIAEFNVLVLPDLFLQVLAASKIQAERDDADDFREELNSKFEEAFKSPLSQLVAYSNYIADKSSFGTHQGVKGLQFPRVMVILDDDDSRGFLFSYEKLFGAAELTKTDRDNMAEGKETTVDRTRRLFYVTCSRAEESLAVVMYTKEPQLVVEFSKAQKLFSEVEITVV